jgi:hypothetical protein
MALCYGMINEQQVRENGKELVVIYFKILFQHLSEVAEGNDEKPQ